MANYMDEETLKLIYGAKTPYRQCWDTIQAMLEGSKSNKHVFLKIATEMEQAGFSKSAKQSASKIKT